MAAPVLLNQVLEALRLSPSKFIIDGTLGAGGHARSIIERLASGGIFLGLDWDETAVRSFEESMKGPRVGSARVILRNRNYVDLPEVLEEEKLGKARSEEHTSELQSQS